MLSKIVGNVLPVSAILIAGLLLSPHQVVPAVDAAATLVRYYNASAHDFGTEDRNPTSVNDFCQAEGESLCDYSAVCPGTNGTNSSLFGLPDCGDDNSTFATDQFLHVAANASECAANSVAAYVEWKGGNPCDITCFTDTEENQGFANIAETSGKIVACCSTTSDGHNTWSKVHENSTITAGCGGGTFSTCLKYCFLFVCCPPVCIPSARA